MIKNAIFLLLTLSAFPVYAQNTVWINDQLPTTVNAEPARNAKFVGTVSAGEAVEVTGEEKNGYLPIRTERLQGWVLTKNIMNTPSVHARIVEREREIAELQSQNQAISGQASSLNASIGDMNSQIQSAQAQAQEAKAELMELKRASGNVIAINERNKVLQNEVVQLEQKIVEQTHEIHRLQQSVNKGQWLVGGGLVVAGLILQWIFSAMYSYRQRRRDSFSDF